MPAHTESLDLAWWQASLAATSSIDGITALSREYVAHLGAERLAALPLQCRPGKLSTAEDVADYAYELVRYHCDLDEAGAGTIQDLAAFFSQAVVAISKLAAPQPTTSELVHLFAATS